MNIRQLPAVLHVAMQMGLYLHRLVVGVWRVVSEDSDQLGAWLAVVHCLHDLGDLEQPTYREMHARLDQPHTPDKLQEVEPLGCLQRVSLEERNDRLNQITPLRDNELRKILFMIVRPMIYIDPTDLEEVLEHVKTLDTLHALRHHKLMCHLEASLVALAVFPVWLPHDMNRKAPFTVYKTDYPADFDQSFLLIVRI